jgi:cyclopropane-fatty-acyl-phospholipid synthase
VNSRAYEATLTHARLGAVRHSFRYPVLLYAFDVDELPRLTRELPWFGHNRIRPVAIHDRDHLGPGPGSIRDKLLALLAPHGLAGGVERIELVTAARWFHHAFNPVSFHYAWGAGGELRCVVAEVNNTFGERHTYVLDALAPDGDGWVTTRPTPKVFHVSPFYERDGEYEFRLGRPGAKLDIAITLRRGGEVAYVARIAGTARPLAGHLRRTLLRAPLVPALTLPRILVQAARLRFQRHLPYHPAPAPAHPLTRRVAPPGPGARVARGLVLRALSRLRDGALEMRLPDGSSRRFGDPAAEPVRIEVTHDRFWTRLARDGDVGLGEAYTAGELRSPDPAAMLELLARNRAAMEAALGWLPLPGRALRRLAHARRANTRRNSPRNIRDHYDLGNAFFELFLDRTWTYSAARFDGGAGPLDQAQERKLDRAAALAGLGPGREVLEIGSGWGGFALRAARETGCRVTGITLSREQLAFARERAEREGLADRVRFELCDYRDARGQYDAIVSIEMIEAVGHRYYGEFFAACDRLLRRGGRLVLQAITIADQRYDAYRRTPDWIQKHVFPGGQVPSLGALVAASARRSRLVLDRLETFGPDYARTLAEWRRRLLERADEAARRGYGPSLVRTWEYYLAYCEAGFRLGELDVGQMVFRRAETA